MVFNLKIRTNEDLDWVDDFERAEIHCNYLSDVSDVYYYLIQMESTYPTSISFDRYEFDSFSITVDDENFMETIRNRIDDILLLNDDCYCSTSVMEYFFN